MGQRANLVVLRDGHWRVYYDHWCAVRLDEELFWGPELALEFIEQREEVTHWLDDLWCEGAALLDFDKRVLLFFGGGQFIYDFPSCRAHLALMSANWQGWDLRWAHQGIVSIAEYLSLDKAQFLASPPSSDRKFIIHPQYHPDESSRLLTIIRAGKTTAHRVYGEDEALACGAMGLEPIQASSAMESLIWDHVLPDGGAHVDFDSNTLSFWWMDRKASLDDIVAAWPGWKVNWLGDDVEGHIALSGLDIQLPYKSTADLQREIIEGLRSPYHKVRSIEDSNQKLELLDRLSRQLPIGGATHA